MLVMRKKKVGYLARLARASFSSTTTYNIPAEVLARTTPHPNAYIPLDISFKGLLKYVPVYT